MKALGLFRENIQKCLDSLNDPEKLKKMKEDGTLQKLKDVLNNFPVQNDKAVTEKQLSESLKTSICTMMAMT